MTLRFVEVKDEKRKNYTFLFVKWQNIYFFKSLPFVNAKRESSVFAVFFVKET